MDGLEQACARCVCQVKNDPRCTHDPPQEDTWPANEMCHAKSCRLHCDPIPVWLNKVQVPHHRDAWQEGPIFNFCPEPWTDLTRVGTRFWCHCICSAQDIVQANPDDGKDVVGIFDSVFRRGCTWLNLNGVTQTKAVQDELNPMVEDAVPQTIVPSSEGEVDSDLESFFRLYGEGKSMAYIECSDGQVVHIASLVNAYFNEDFEKASTDWL